MRLRAGRSGANEILAACPHHHGGFVVLYASGTVDFLDWGDHRFELLVR